VSSTSRQSRRAQFVGIYVINVIGIYLLKQGSKYIQAFGDFEVAFGRRSEAKQSNRQEEENRNDSFFIHEFLDAGLKREMRRICFTDYAFCETTTQTVSTKLEAKSPERVKRRDYCSTFFPVHWQLNEFSGIQKNTYAIAKIRMILFACLDDVLFHAFLKNLSSFHA